MKILSKATIVCAIALTTMGVNANSASSLKHAKKATELRQSVFSLLGSNMGPLGAMAKGKMSFDAEKIEKHALRINQLSLMIADYTRTNTSSFEVSTEALPKVWQEREAFIKRITALTDASANLQTIAMSKDEKAIKKAISGVGKTCGGCHDDFKAE